MALLLAGLGLVVLPVLAAAQNDDLDAYPWLYRRSGPPLTDGEPVASVLVVGDVMLGRGVAPALGGAGVSDPLAALPWLGAADLTLGNLESLIVDRPPPDAHSLAAPPGAAVALRQAGFDLLGLANNHALDRGARGLVETVARLRLAGVAAVGAGPSVETACAPVVREVNGIRLAVLAFDASGFPSGETGTPGWTTAGWDQARALAAIGVARREAQGVIVSVHWGYEYQVHSDPYQRRLARAMVEAGADLVVGHHPHVVQETEVQGESFVAYSLGNFVFDQQQGDTRQGLALRALFDRDGLRAVQGLPVWAGSAPRLMSPQEASPLLERVRPPVPRLGFACPPPLRGPGYACHPVEVDQTPVRGPFVAGGLDLTGDGVPERVRLADGRVTVSGEGYADWEGLPEWQVVDLALGDPDDDGRGEMVLALWKPDADGQLRSHPFIVGYRGGAYRVVWGGSAVADPILELELGDLDGDGVQELVVLEEADEERTVAVWRWHGWGYTLIWRSPPGPYSDLALTPDRAGNLVISLAGTLTQGREARHGLGAFAALRETEGPTGGTACPTSGSSSSTTTCSAITTITAPTGSSRPSESSTTSATFWATPRPTWSPPPGLRRFAGP
ncbi:MAG: CapA family protein [Anaerolineae bacterium]|nr:CapA family protein [Anaerolineae bacterium]